MQIYGPFRFQSVQPTRGGAADSRAPAAAGNPSSTAPIDQLDLSPSAQQAGRLEATSSASAGDGEIRAERIASIRRAIADGSYETPEKLDIALDRLLDDLG